MTNCCVYYRGELSDGELSQIIAFAEGHGITVSETLSDTPPAVASFRRLQDYIKLGLCSRVLLPSYTHLGDDEWLCRENELFIRRNGAVPIFIKPHRGGSIERIANAVKKYWSPENEWELRNGEILPMPPARTGGRRLPYGYTSVNGAASIDEQRAETVRLIFSMYAEGMTLDDICDAARGSDSEMTIGGVRNILYCGRYYGSSEGGTALPGIISRAVRFAAEERKSSRAEEPLRIRPYFRVRNMSSSSSSGETERILLETAVEDEVSMLVKGDALQTFIAAAEQKAAHAKAAVGPASEAQTIAAEALAEYLAEAENGGREDHQRLIALRDACYTSSARLRRVELEAELYSVTPEEIKRFFERTANVKRLAPAERAFIVNSFLVYAAAADDGYSAVFALPSGGYKKRFLVLNRS